MKLTTTKILYAVFFLALIIRVLYPLADPPPWTTGDMGLYADEGYKTLAAKNKVIFGDNKPHPNDSYAGWSALSPVSYLLFVIFFKLFGTGIVQARLLNILASMISLYLVYIIIRKAFNKSTALLAISLLGLNISYIIYNKIALLETSLAMFLLFSIYFWMLSKQKSGYIYLSLLSFFLAFLIKPLAILFLPALIYMIYTNLKDQVTRKQIVVISSGLLFIVLILVALFPKLIKTIIQFVTERNPGSLGTFSSLIYQFFYQDFFVLNTILLFFFFGYLVKVFQRMKKITSTEIVFLLWSAGGMLLLILQTYRPPRYFVTIIPAMCVLAAIFLSDKIKIKRKLSSYTIIFILTIFFSLHLYYFSQKLGVSIGWYILITIFLVAISLVVFPKIVFSKRLVNILIVSYVVVNLLMVLFWFSSITHDVYEANKDIETRLGEDDVLLGMNWVPALCLDTSLTCYHVSGEFNQQEDVFNEFGVTYFISDGWEQPRVDKVGFFLKETFFDSITYVTSYEIGRFNVSLYKFDKDVYYASSE